MPTHLLEEKCQAMRSWRLNSPSQIPLPDGQLSSGGSGSSGDGGGDDDGGDGGSSTCLLSVAGSGTSKMDILGGLYRVPRTKSA